jgi:outer membrane receptor for ferrienterochelin and colicin
MLRIKVLFILLLFLFLVCPVAFSQSDSSVVRKDTVDYYEMSLEQLLTLKAHGVPSELEKLINSLISVASKKPLNVRESPSIVSLITEEEIKKSGARDIMDVLRLVPGVDFGLDVEGVVGLGMRGNWAHEGKVLVLLDGQEMNEILFATTQFGNHFPIEQIKKIEVIRGPGSAIYGGFAEYGVINIVTRQADDINGLTVSGTYGQMEKDYGRRNANLAIGKKFGDFSFSLSGVLGQGQRSDQTYRDFKDTSYSMAGNSSLNTKYFNAAIGYKGLSFRLIGDFYETKIGDGYGDVIKSGPVAENFNSVYSELKYVIKFSDKFTITPRVNYKTQTPWQSPSYTGTKAYDRTASRTTGNITASWNVNRHINFVFGAETYQDKATDHVDSSYFRSNGKQNISYYNYSFFAQGLIKTRIVNFIVGARYDKHNAYGSAFVPRVGLTKKYKKFHFKALYSNSFRAPAIENINDAPASKGIKPELTQVMEVELGYQVTRKSILTVNAYDITTRNPIVYYTDSTNSDYYTNSGHSGTQGLEAEYRLKDKWGYITLNYAFYSVANKEKIKDYAVSGSSSSLVGFANHRLNFNACWNLTRELSVNASGSYYGSRWAYTKIDTLGVPVLEKLKPSFLLNFFVRYNTPLKGLSIGVGCYDILNEKFKFVQSYNGGHAPLPGPSREFVFRLQYNLNFKGNKN